MNWQLFFTIFFSILGGAVALVLCIGLLLVFFFKMVKKSEYIGELIKQQAAQSGSASTTRGPAVPDSAYEAMDAMNVVSDTVKDLDNAAIAQLIVLLARDIISPLAADVHGVGNEVQQEILYRCGECLVLAGSFKDRSREQLIDALEYLHEYKIELSK